MRQTSDVPVYDMGPLLHSPGAMEANVHASAGLDDNERQKIKSFIDRHVGEHKARRLGPTGSYVLHPHVREEREEDGTVLDTRFSCAGFAVEAYGYARLQLIDLSKIPKASLQEVLAAYPDEAAQLARLKLLREEWGLTGAGPWPILYGGFVIHALARSAAEIRQTSYVPRASDVNFT
jgi:hypothetical protein